MIERFREEGFNVGNNKAFMYARAMLKGKVLIVSDQVDRSDLQNMMLDGVPSLQEAVDLVCERKTGAYHRSPESGQYYSGTIKMK